MKGSYTNSSQLSSMTLLIAGLVCLCCSTGSGYSNTEDSTSAAHEIDSDSLDGTDTTVSHWIHTWTPYSDMPECEHVEVVEDCEDGWCRIPKGCFVMGSPEDDWGRSPMLEDQLTVVLDQPFEIMQYEVTLAHWYDLGFSKPQEHPLNDLEKVECADNVSCPADPIGWWSALAYANRLSEKNSLSPCYVLTKCTGEVGEQAYACESVSTNAPSLYECEGYRLPTEAEWEYAARAGTQTTFYAGPIIPTEFTSDCSYQPYLDDFAWYCYNSDRQLRPVGKKKPNAWGLYDMLGNQAEWTNDLGNVPLPEGPIHNLNAELEMNSMRSTRGGLFYSDAVGISISKRLGASTSASAVHTGYGFRLVRTLPD